MMFSSNSGWKTLGALVVLALVLTGCRAFEPEAVIVNKAPETYIIGAPPEDGGGYYHFHVFWYGSDEDGRVERFVWALTDTTVQDPDTVDDEEDTRFNPALDATTLEIGHYTTRTDSVFNFTIDQGVNPSYDMTLHMVAIDDYGDFDRTPARLHFFSNTLGNPSLHFFRIDGADTVPLGMGEADTVGFGHSYQVGWAGSSPNIRGYDPEGLALVDTVYPYDDGLFGYKWRIIGELGGNCVPTLEDCWHPRKYNEATGDSFSFFGTATSLLFENNGTGTSPFQKLLPSGEVQLEVNSIDIAGVEVADFMRPFSFVVNYDPETRMVVGFDPEHPEDPEQYPYYIRLNDPAQVHHPFAEGDRIPDRTYVVVKALARDDLRDSKLDPDFGVAFTGFLQGVRDNFFGGSFTFTSETSEINYDPAWPADGEAGWYGDTLGFLVEPRTTFTINMQAIDEHGRRDGSPATLSFDVGYPPCIQCIETLPKSFSTSAYGSDIPCYDGVSSHECFDGEDVYHISRDGLGPDDLEYKGKAFILVDKLTGFTQTVLDTTDLTAANYAINARMYRMEILLHGKDDELEQWSNPLYRSMSWRYQVDYDCDVYNQIKDGGGNDNINDPTWGLRSALDEGLEVDPATGVWKISVDITIPADLVSNGPTYYKDIYLLYFVAGGDQALADDLFDKTTRQTGHGVIQAVMQDQTACGFLPNRPAKYNFFQKVRPSVTELPIGRSWRDCQLEQFVPGIQQGIDLSQASMASLDNQPATKEFRLIVSTPEGDFECSTGLK